MKSLYPYIAALSVSLVMIAAQSCTDDAFSSDSNSGRPISFDVSSRPFTRADQPTGISVEAFPLSGSSSPAYLVAVETDGIEPINRQATRGSLLNTNSLDSFGVFASRSDASSLSPEYMYNVAVTRANGWAPTDEYMWPGDGSLHFTAYAPYHAAASSEGITALPSQNGTPAISFKTPAEVSDQFDLMMASPVEASASPCPISLSHALTAIRFASGAELAPCTVKSISVSGIADTSILDLESGQWTDPTGAAVYTISPDLTLAAEEGSQYVAPDTPLASDDLTMILLPQTLPSDAQISLSVEIEGKESTLTASIAGAVWTAGKTITYRLSGNPDTDILTLDVAGDFSSTYTGATIPFTVKSYLSKSGSVSNIDWKAEFVDDSGNVIQMPGWVKSMDMTGAGTTAANVITTVNDVVFHAMSSVTTDLQTTSDINASSGYTPYNLSSSTGAPAVENTANLYLISAPGSYTIPLVYGNAISDGAANTGAYTSSSRSSTALKTFINHLGAGITSPYIYENAGCTPASASIIWEDQLNTVRNVSLSADGHSISFDIPAQSIREGNAIVAVKDADGLVMWSWQLWITSYQPSANIQTIPVSGTDHNYMTEYLGYEQGGDEVEFPSASVKIRFSQINVPEGMTPLTKTITLSQSEGNSTTVSSAPYYQSGRKDPIMAYIDHWYNRDHSLISALPTINLQSVADPVQQGILSPQAMLLAEHSQNLEYANLWNPTLSRTENVKSIYDPSPVGYKVPSGTAFRTLAAAKDDVVTPTGNGYTVSSASLGTTIRLCSFGYRASASGNHSSGQANIWYGLVGASETYCYIVAGTTQRTTSNPSYHGFNILAEKE